MFFSEYNFQTKKEKTDPFKTLGTLVRDAMQSWHILFNPVWVPWVLAAPAQLKPSTALLGRAVLVPVYHTNVKLCHRPMCESTIGNDVLWDLRQPEAQPCTFPLLPLRFILPPIWALGSPRRRLLSQALRVSCTEVAGYHKEKSLQWRRSILKPSQKECCLFSSEKKKKHSIGGF